MLGSLSRKWCCGRSWPDNTSKSMFLRYQTKSNSLFRIALLQLFDIAENTPIITSKANTRKFGELGSSRYICMLVWYQQKSLSCTIKWIKTKLQAEGYGCHTCQHIHHYTLLTSWLYPKEMRKDQNSKLSDVYVRNFCGNFFVVAFRWKWTNSIYICTDGICEFTY